MRSPIHNSSIKNLKDGCVGINAMVELTQKVGTFLINNLAT